MMNTLSWSACNIPAIPPRPRIFPPGRLPGGPGKVLAPGGGPGSQAGDISSSYTNPDHHDQEHTDLAYTVNICIFVT